MILTIKKYAILFFFLLISVVHAGYNDLILTPKFKYSTGEPYQGNFDISIGFVTYNTYVDSFKSLNSSQLQVSRTLSLSLAKSILFVAT